MGEPVEREVRLQAVEALGLPEGCLTLEVTLTVKEESWERVTEAVGQTAPLGVTG